jgi:hypothetical protein
VLQTAEIASKLDTKITSANLIDDDNTGFKQVCDVNTKTNV